MIIIAGTVPIDPEKREAALEAMRDMQAASEAETGCISYRYYMNPWDDTQVFVFEEWEDEAALEAHFKMPHMDVFQAQIPDIVTGPMDIKRYDVDKVSEA